MIHVHVMLAPLEVQEIKKNKYAPNKTGRPIISTDKANMIAIKTVAGQPEEKVKLTAGPDGMASCKFADGKVFVSDVPNLMLADQLANVAPGSRRQVMKVMKKPGAKTVIKKPATSEEKKDCNLSFNIH